MVLTQERVRELLDYDQITGRLTWRHRPDGPTSWNVRFAGEEAGSVDEHDGYIRIGISGVKYLAHHLAWLHHHGYLPTEVDHEDHARTNNAIGNLRDVERIENARNHTLQANNKTGRVGVTEYRPGRFRAYIYLNKKQIGLGCFGSIAAASAARDDAEAAMGFHVNHGERLAA